MTNDRDYFLRTERLGLRHWRQDDLPFALLLWGDPAVTRLIDARGQLTEEQVRERLLHETCLQQEHGVQYWPMFLLRSEAKTPEFVGCCGLRPYDPAKVIYEIGVHICAAHWRRGYALEASQAVIRYAFDTLRANGLFSGHNPNNHSSRALLLKLGFEYIGDEFYPPTGLQHPSYLLQESREKGVRAKTSIIYPDSKLIK